MTPTHDPAYAAVATEVAAAREALIREAGEPGAVWIYPAELRARARNGWTSGAMGIALDELIEDGTFEVNGDLCVRLRAKPS